jgi:hypothetical protein
LRSAEAKALGPNEVDIFSTNALKYRLHYSFLPTEGGIAGIYRWRIILADTNFFHQSVSAADYRGRLNWLSTFYQIR